MTAAADADWLFTPIAGDAGRPVSGVAEEALGKTSLTVPAYHEGKPVVGLTENALNGCAVLAELRLPASIESLPDRLFAGTPAMDRLILEHTGTVCRPAGQTFDGADRVRVFVPSEAYHLYRDGTGCESNPWALYLDRICTY